MMEEYTINLYYELGDKDRVPGYRTSTPADGI